MRLLGHDTSSEISRTGNNRPASRGAWYRDPFGVADERWWDGTRWSREVRGSTASANGDAPSAEPPARPDPLDADVHDRRGRSSNEDRDGDFPVSIGAVGEEQLSVVSSPRKPGTHCQVLASRGRAGSISVFGAQMARLTCADGAWLLKRSPRDPGALTIESTDHERAGRFVRRRWPPGGTIALIDGTEVELRRSRPGRWKVQSADGRACLAEFQRSRHRKSQTQELKVTVHSTPPYATNASMIVLASCALLMLPTAVD